MLSPIIIKYSLYKSSWQKARRQAKSRDHGIIGRGNIFRLWKDKDWKFFVETMSLNSINENFFAGCSGNTSIDISERYKSAWFLVISSIMLQIIHAFLLKFLKNPKFGRGRIKTFCDIVPVARFEAFRALQFSRLESFRALNPYSQNLRF